MTDLTREAATSLLSDAVAIWRLQPGLVEDVVDAAVDCLVADVDTPSLAGGDDASRSGRVGPSRGTRTTAPRA